MKLRTVFRFVAAIAAVLTVPPVLSARQPVQPRERTELILRLQDLRDTGDPRFSGLLSDPDSVVRERAIRACGSIQDTSAISLLVDHLSDSCAGVRRSAAFAVGQTAGLLSDGSRAALERDLIRTRLDHMDLRRTSGENPEDRLIEEFGKFGSAQALADLVRRFGSEEPPVHARALSMSIARFGMRGVVSGDALGVLVRLALSGVPGLWQPVYALQRIGDRPEIRPHIADLLPLCSSPDPLVRMYVAALIGKVGTGPADPVRRLADADPDWRVRVNAFRALGNLHPARDPEVLESFRRAFADSNVSVAVTAISSFGNSDAAGDQVPGLRPVFDALEDIVENRSGRAIWQIRSEAAIALAKLKKGASIPLLSVPHPEEDALQSQLLVALGLTGAPAAAEALTRYLGYRNPLLYRTALEGLGELVDRNPADSALAAAAVHAAVAGLESQDVAIVTTAASMLGDSLLLRRVSAAPLVGAMSRLHVPDDVEAIQQIASTLGKLGDSSAVGALRSALRIPDRSVMLAAAAAIRQITGHDPPDTIPRRIEPVSADLDFAYLRALPETVRVRLETVRGEIMLELYKNMAPFTVMSFLKLAAKGFYQGLTFHRVVPNFVIQGGDPRGDGWGGAGYSLRSEFSAGTFETGSVGVASAGKDTEGSQFFITQSPQPHLDGRYTLFGKVTSGMDVVGRILIGDRIAAVSILP